MNEQTFQNFDLVIEKSGKKYRTYVSASPAGEASGEFILPFSTSELDNFIFQMGQPVKGARKSDSTELGAIKKFGETLFNTVFNGEVKTCFLRSLDLTYKLRIRLHLKAPELHNLPWEYLYDSQRDLFLAQSNDTPIIRYFVDLNYKIPTPVKPPLKILVMISSPEGYPKLDVEKHWNRLNTALGPLIRDGRVVLERIENPTLDELQEGVRHEDVHIFHFIGHGKYMEQGHEGKLLLEDENGKGTPVGGKRLGTLLQDSDSLRLVVLNACEGARTSAEDPYAGVAQTLVQKGIPSVIAMQFEIFENAAIKFAQKFYEALVDGSPVDVALSEARKAIYVSGNDREWGTPVLFSRAPDSVLFRQIDASQKPITEKDATVQETVTKASDSPAPAISFATLSKNPKLLYSGIFLVVAILALIGGISFRNNRVAQTAATTSAASTASADTATALAVQDSLSLTGTAKAVPSSTAVDKPTETATITQTATLTFTPTVTSTATPITPPLDCLDTNRWKVAINTDDTPPSEEATIEDGCVTAYKDLGIFASSAGLSFLKDSFRIPGIFGINTLLPKDPKEVKLTIKLYEVSGGGQGEFWISLSNGIDPEQDSMGITIQPNGAVKYYINGSPTTLLDPINAKPLPYTYEINLAINGNRVNSVVNSTYYRPNLTVNGGPKYLFFGYKKRSNQGTVFIHVDVVDMEFK